MVVKLIIEYPGVRWLGDVVAAASTVTAAFARKLQAAFACKGSDHGGSGGGGDGDRPRGGGSRERSVVGSPRVADRGAVIAVAASGQASAREWWRSGTRPCTPAVDPSGN